MTKVGGNVRYAEIDRESEFARVQIVLDLDGGTRRDIATGVRMLDLLIKVLAKAAQVDVGIGADGDLAADDRQISVQVALALGEAILTALQTTPSIEGVGTAHGLCDDSLVLCCLELSDSGTCYCELPFKSEKLGDLSTASIPAFMRAFCTQIGATVHLRHIAGIDERNMAEAAFKAFGLALQQAVRRAEARLGQPKS